MGAPDLTGLPELRDLPVNNVDPLELSNKELIALACAVVRVSALLCDMGQKTAPYQELRDSPYIWDIKED